jgi:uncharacterized protein (UPF0332 family)
VAWEDYWLKGKENLEVALLAHQSKKYNVCASRAYYAVFLASIAALLKLTSFRAEDNVWEHGPVQIHVFDRESFGRSGMSRKISQQSKRLAKQVEDALAKYIAALEKIYPEAKGTTRVLRRQDDRIVVSIPLPTRAPERMRLFDYMAEVGTSLLLETDQHIILAGR